MNNSQASSPIQQLTPSQREVLESGLLTSGFNCILQMPTGSGKTWLAEQAIASVLAQGKRAIYLTPLRALATELTNRWSQRFRETAVGVFTGDYSANGKSYPVPFADARLLVMTPERLDACTRSWRSHWHWIPDVDLVVVDELHLLGERNRGARLEGALSRFRRLNPFARLLGLSATLGNRQELADWLDGVEYYSDWRPIPLTWRIVRYRKATEKPGLLVQQVAQMAQAGGQSLVFVQSRRRAEELSRTLNGAGIVAEHHHAGLNHTERHRIESAFRSECTRALVATGTLEMGLNLPVRQVILYDLQTFDGQEFQPLDINTVWQRAGRAGRPGHDSQGEAVLLAPSWDNSAEVYLKGKFSAIQSGLANQAAFAEQVVAEVASGLARTSTQLQAVFQQSLAHRQSQLPDVHATVNRMCQAGILVEHHEEEAKSLHPRLKATRLGRIAMRHMLAPSTVLLFRKATEQIPNLTLFDLLLLAASSQDCEPLLSVSFEELDCLASALAQEPTRLLHGPVSGLKALLGITGKRLLAAVKCAVIARTWTRTASEEHVASQFDCYAFEIARLRESLARLLLALSDILRCNDLESTEIDSISLAERAAILTTMVKSGLDVEAVTLTMVPGIGAAWARKLRDSGINDIEDLALSDTVELTQLGAVSAKRASEWIASAIEQTRNGGAYRYREDAPTITVTPPDWPAEIDSYRLRRSIDLQVTGPDGDRFLVRGGLEPHIVLRQREGYLCDCQDAANGHTCKHTLAVRLHSGDKRLRVLVRQLGTNTGDDQIDLHSLWFEGGIPAKRRTA